MHFRHFGRLLLLTVALAGFAAPAIAEQAASGAQARKVRVTGVVRDDSNNITLPGLPVEVAGGETVYTDVDGRYVVDLVPGTYEIKVSMDGYETRDAEGGRGAGERVIDANVGLSMTRFAETVTVTAPGFFMDAVTSSAEAMVAERKSAATITDNMGSQDMKKNADTDAAAAMSRVTGLSVVDNQYVFVRGLGERYSNTTLSGSTLPTTEPDKKVVPLDLFPAGLLDSVQVSKSYSPDRSAEFAGGLVQIQPLKFPNRAVLDFSYGLNFQSNATGKSIPLSAIGSRDWLGFDNGVRQLPAGIPDNKIVRSGIYTPDVGYNPDQITGFGRELADDQWRPTTTDGAPGQNWGIVFGNRFGKLGVVASMTHSYKESFIDEQRAFYRIGDSATDLEAVSDYRIQTGTQKAQLGGLANIAYQFSGNNRLSLENFYSHTGRDEGRFFEGPNTENLFYYYNNRLQFIEEGLISTALAGDHFVRGAGNSRIDWRVNFATANRDEPDLRETLYQSPFIAGTLEPNLTTPPVLADESQSGFRMFNTLDDQTIDGALNWSTFASAGSRPTQYKFGVNYVDRSRDFQSRRFRFIPIILTKDGLPTVSQTLTPEELYTTNNIGTAFRFNEETRPVDAYNGEQTTASVYGMVDIALSARTRINGGARVERADQTVTTLIRSACSCGPSRPISRTPTCSRPSTWCKGSRATRTCASATARRSTARSSASWRPSSSPTWSAAAPPAAIPICSGRSSRTSMRAGKCSRAAAAFSRPACSSSTSTSRSSASSSPAPSRSPPSRTPTRRATSASNWKRPTTWPRLLRQRQLHLRRLEDHAAARAADGADVARASAGGPVEEPVQLHRRVHAQGVLGPRAGQLLRRSHFGRRRQPGARHVEEGRRRSIWCSRSGSDRGSASASAART